MTKKIKDLTENEIEEICDFYEHRCKRAVCHQDCISICPLKMTFGCLLKTKAYKKLNEEIEV